MSQNAATDDGGTGYGDSGGPTFWIDPDTGETDIVVAVTSWGDVPTVATGIAYRIDTSDALDFIAEVADDWLEEP
jgi:secreted trypsin-like serine protease